MSISGQKLYTAYRESVGGTNHDGTFTMPKHISGLGKRQEQGWIDSATFCNNHFSAAMRENTKRKALYSATRTIRNLEPMMESQHEYLEEQRKVAADENEDEETRRSAQGFVDGSDKILEVIAGAKKTIEEYEKT